MEEIEESIPDSGGGPVLASAHGVAAPGLAITKIAEAAVVLLQSNAWRPRMKMSKRGAIAIVAILAATQSGRAQVQVEEKIVLRPRVPKTTWSA